MPCSRAWPHPPGLPAHPPGIPEPSHVLGALGLTETQSKASIRFSFGRFTTDEDIEALNSLSVESVKMPV